MKAHLKVVSLIAFFAFLNTAIFVAHHIEAGSFTPILKALQS